MHAQSLWAAGLLFAAGLGLFGVTAPAQPPAKDEPKTESKPLDRVLPGLRRDGFVQLPNQWSLKPAGRHIETGDFPVNVALHPTGEFAAVLCAGYGPHEIVIVDLNPERTRVLSRVQVHQAFYGLTWSPDGKQVFASGGEDETVHVFDFDKGYLTKGKALDASVPKKKGVVGGLAFDPTGKDLFVAVPWADAVVRVPLVNPDNKKVIPFNPEPVKKEPGKGEPPSPPDGRKEEKPKAKAPAEEPKEPEPQVYPYTCLVEPGGKRCFVSLWARAGVAVIDLETNAVVETWPTAEHPTEMALAPRGDALYVACANSTKVSVIDPATGKGLQTINCALYPNAPNGNTPNSLTLTPDGEMLFVANADANNLSVFAVKDRTKAVSLGFVPTGWYPTSVRYNASDKQLYIANGKGLSSKSNRNGPNPLVPQSRNLNEYIGQLLKGSLTVMRVPTPDQMATHSKTAYACSPLRNESAVRAEAVEPGNPIPKKLGEASPIKYCIYVVKENRTYDQVFGDIKEGNGDASLCLFPESVTPNHHKLAKQFVLLDNLYVDGEVSADGHEWTMGAYATDFVEKIWPLSYRGGKIFGYPSEGAKDLIARPSGGYLWDKCAEAKVSYRAYGEWVNNGKRRPDGGFEDGTPAVPALEGKIDSRFRGYDLEYTDVKRAERFISELKRFEQAGEMPRMQVVRLPNDHTAGTKVGAPTVTAMVADNDLALGLLVEGVSKSKFWKETAIFVIEDDTQNGPDHVDAHRSVALVVSPYTKRKFVDSTLYSTTSMLRTMELILGVKPMSQFDAAARPMYNSFTAKPDLTGYTHEAPKVDLTEKNKPGGFGAAWMEKQNLAKEDTLDDILFSEIIWKAVRGQRSPMPPPVRAAFFVPLKAAKKDHDDDDDDDD
ncbi:alkaline phosphatase family protein [Gemmata sp. JC717]|uniref:bifunctional YncE family protein/alkaline phosphatase family protein n=1 Tax=Gemmata algarum TaxID=2975278 RepID=UPI0021BB45C8|nr:beta-propeller fold lactonase family protein [Gemmata algarum]MDY3554661.1 alkaline phosphatase family protein [Gemmata algarum]